jgi:hypothetical protein
VQYIEAIVLDQVMSLGHAIYRVWHKPCSGTRRDHEQSLGVHSLLVLRRPFVERLGEEASTILTIRDHIVLALSI